MGTIYHSPWVGYL
uniref:Uncharacterized protein n=1 Tax=Arundo donax TaxID=35708 RepID=A0A0A8YSH3_ARUDO